MVWKEIQIQIWIQTSGIWIQGKRGGFKVRFETPGFAHNWCDNLHKVVSYKIQISVRVHFISLTIIFRALWPASKTLDYIALSHSTTVSGCWWTRPGFPVKKTQVVFCSLVIHKTMGGCASIIRGDNRGSLCGLPQEKYVFSGFPQLFNRFSSFYSCLAFSRFPQLNKFSIFNVFFSIFPVFRDSNGLFRFLENLFPVFHRFYVTFPVFRDFFKAFSVFHQNLAKVLMTSWLRVIDRLCGYVQCTIVPYWDSSAILAIYQAIT